MTDDFDPHEGPPGYVYERIADHLTGRIAAGEFPPDSMLPGERELSETYGVGLATVRRALDVLRERGTVVTLPAKGTFVLRQEAAGEAPADPPAHMTLVPDPPAEAEAG